MGNVPAIGGAKGIFEILVPGVFVLVNIVTAVYVFPWGGREARAAIQAVGANSMLSFVVLICLGYLLGVLLRLTRADRADEWSAAWIRRFRRTAKNVEGRYRAFAIEPFPYISWLREMAEEYMPPSVVRYYESEWAHQKRRGPNKQFFNLCKIAVISSAEPASSALTAEILAAEALTRYGACMIYALALALGIAIASAVACLMALQWAAVGWLLLGGAYALALVLLLKNFRFVRIKEVETIFGASFVKRIRIEGIEGAGVVGQGE